MAVSALITPAWIQAIGSVVGIFVAVWVPYRQRHNMLRDARDDGSRQEKEFLQRLTTGLRAEINACLRALEIQKEGVDHALRHVQEAREKGAIVTGGRIQPGSMAVTDAIIYRQMAGELGRLPPALISSVVQFYALTLNLGRLADAAPAAQQAFETVQKLAPRAKMHALVLLKTLDKFEASGFVSNAEIRLTQEEVRELAAKARYPLDEVLRERGLQS